MAEGVEAHGGRLVELRGDEALAVFTSARQAIRAAVDLQGRVGEGGLDADTPLKVGIGIDSGEAVELEDGSFRGGSLNIAARLCGRAHGGDVIVSEPTVRLAGRLAGPAVHRSRARAPEEHPGPRPHLPGALRARLASAEPLGRHVLRQAGGRTLGWRLGLVVVVLAALTAAGVVYLTAGSGAEQSNASPPPPRISDNPDGA